MFTFDTVEQKVNASIKEKVNIFIKIASEKVVTH